MTCSIIVDHGKTVGRLISGSLQEIYVEGTTQGCSAIRVTLTCGSVTLPAANAQVSPTGNTWWHTFKSLPTACACNGQIKVKAECVDGKESCVNADHDTAFDLRCEPKIVVGLCPAVSIATGAFGACRADGTRSVTVSASVQGPGGLTAELVDGAQNVLDGPRSGTGAVNLSHSSHYPGGQLQTFKVRVVQPAGCGSSSHTVQVPPCGGGTGGPQGGGSWGITPPRVSPDTPGLKAEIIPGPFEEIPPPRTPGPITKSHPCGSMVWIVGAALALAAAAASVTLAVNLCMPAASSISWWWAIGPAIGAGALVALWYFLCSLIPDCDCPKGCDWAQIGTMTAFASSAVVGWLAGCCPQLAWLSAGLLAAYGGALAAWWALCKPNACKVLRATLVALASGAIPAVSYIALVPTLAACGSKIVASAAATVAAILAVAAAIKCK